jgi:hypothetical protein
VACLIHPVFIGDLTILEILCQRTFFGLLKRAVSRKRLQKMREASKRERVPPLGFAFIYADLGEKEQAFEWLEKAYEERSGALVHLGDGMVCTCDALRSDPRFADLLRRIGLPPPS